MYAPEVYTCAADILEKMKKSGEFVQDETACYYLYALTMDGRTQMGLVCCASADDYLNNVIKKHENTREDKELDRIRHVDRCSAHTGPIFLAYRTNQEVQRLIEKAVKEGTLYDFVSEDGIRHQVWSIVDDLADRLTGAFANVKNLYIADGHHRAASAVKVALKRRKENPGYTGEEEFNYFLAVLFPEEQLKILDYNRVVHKLDIKVKDSLLTSLENGFMVEKVGDETVRPRKKGEIGMYFEGSWYRLTAKKEICVDDPVEGLDVSILQNEVLKPLMGITDPKTDARMQFVGGIRGLKELEDIVDKEKDSVAFAMYPTSMKELLDVADAGRLMPPKSTWFEPKLRSGLFIHEF